jgi:hypothetical protein
LVFGASALEMHAIWGSVAGTAVGGLAAFLVGRQYERERNRDLSE